MGNVANFIVMPFAAADAARDALILMTDVAERNQFLVKIEADIEAGADVVVQPKESADGSAYTSLGSAQTVVPGGAVSLALNSKKYTAFSISGGAGRLIISADARTQHISQLP